MSYLYLSSPYTHPDSVVREQRYLNALEATHWLLLNHIWTFSPIVHCHEIARRNDLPRDHDFWLEYNHLMILKSRGIAVLQCEGWKDSLGIADEIQYATTLGLPISHMRRQGNRYAFHALRTISSPDPQRSDPSYDLRASQLPDASEVG